MTIAKSELAGLILVGGKSERMGRDKARLRLAGIPLWQISGSILEPFVDRILLVDSACASEFPGSYRVIHDDPPGSGPLGGLVTGLEQSGYEHHILLAVDYPLVQPALLQLLLDKTMGHWAVCGRSESFLEPMVGYYHAACAPVIRRMLAEDENRTHMLFERAPSAILDDDEYNRADPDHFSQINVNTPAELERAETVFRRVHGQQDSGQEVQNR